MVGWCHRLGGHEFEQTLGVGDGQGSLAWGSPWGCKESEATELIIDLIPSKVVKLDIKVYLFFFRFFSDPRVTVGY